MKLFGTDGIRGVAGSYPLDDATILAIGAAAAEVLKEISPDRAVIIGRDTRQSGEHISGLLERAFSSRGIAVWDVGVIPTPGISHLVKQQPVLAGVVISASHNPYQDNGIKFFGHDGTKLSDAVESRIEALIALMKAGKDQPLAEAAGADKPGLLTDGYSDFLARSFTGGTMDGIRLVLDCANGATCVLAPEVFRSLGAHVTLINASPDGKNINRDSGSLHPGALSKATLASRAHCGIAFDGDGDRVMFVDEKGVVRDGDYFLAIAALHLRGRQRLVNNTLVTTVMANLGLMRSMERYGVSVHTTPVGDRYVYEAMVSSGSVLGGEQSGHVIFKEYHSTGDGILSALQMISIMKESGKPLSELASVMEKYPQVLINARVGKKIPLESLPETGRSISEAQGTLEGDGRVLVRYSGTENLLRVMIEGRDEKVITKMAHVISETAQKEIGHL